MGRKENRKKSKNIKKKLTEEQYKNMIGRVDEEFIKDAIKERTQNFVKLSLESMVEALEKNGVSSSKVDRICKDWELGLERRSRKC